MTEKEKREAYIRASDARVATWPKARRDAFYRAAKRHDPSCDPMPMPNYDPPDLEQLQREIDRAMMATGNYDEPESPI